MWFRVRVDGIRMQGRYECLGFTSVWASGVFGHHEYGFHVLGISSLS